ncbi:MAG: hypothetical protein JNN13_12705 [Planctomycetes bacterium]|nr:hypothetical protein [Planctomycetota bacterium]
MMPALSRFALAAIPLVCPLAPEPGGPELTIEHLPFAMAFHVSGPEAPYVGAVIGSLAPDLAHYFQGLPPLLADFVLLDLGLGDAAAGYTAVLPQSVFPAGVTIYVQGVTLTGRGLEASAVHDFVLDVTVPPVVLR